MDEAGKKLLQLMIPEYFGGYHVRTEADADEPRVHEARYYDLQAGDVIILAPDLLLDDPIYAVFDGETLLYPEDGKLKTMLELQFGKALSYQFFVGLRPTQVQ